MYHYEKDEDGNWLAVNDVKCIDIVKKDPIKKSEYLKFIQEPARLAEEYGLIHSLNVESRDPVVDEQLKIHKECIDKMVNLPIIAVKRSTTSSCDDSYGDASCACESPSYGACASFR